MAKNQTAYLNGDFVPLDEAKVSVLDRGFVFGDGIYEVVPVYDRVPFRWDDHLARLNRSLARIQISNPLDQKSWSTLVSDLVQRHPWNDQFIYFQVTRGVAKRDHAYPADTTPTVFGMCSEFVRPPKSQVTEGVATISLGDERWMNCDIKSVSLLGNVLARQAAVDAQAMEAILFRDGYLTEGAASTVWVVRHNKLLVPLKDRRILQGIRIGLIEELCQSESIELEHRNITREEVLQADELILSSATKEVAPVTTLDGNLVGNGKPGPVFAKLHDAYQRAIASSATKMAAQPTA